MVHYFEPPIDDRARRRSAPQRSADDTDPDDEDANNDDNGNTTTPPPPPADFPHAPLPRDPPDRPASAQILRQRNLARQHLHVLNTILHKSLLEHDFARAKRAFGLLLRVQVAGQRVDLRRKGVWGIGAEVLLRQHPAGGRSEEDDAGSVDDSDSDQVTMSNTAADPWPTDEGFSAARDYYERLILQYPYRRVFPNAVSAQHFYPPLFGLWIFQVQKRSERAVAALQRGVSPSSPSEHRYGDDAYFPTSGGDRTTSRHEHGGLRAVKSRELEDAREIAERMANVTALPPYDRDAELLKLRGMVALWMADLVLASTGSEADFGSEEDFREGRGRTRAVADAREFRAEAKVLLRRAREHGWTGMGDREALLGGAEVDEEVQGRRDGWTSDDY